MEFLRTILENSQYSIITAFILGLMSSLGPCTLATNITAIGFISRDIENRRRVFISGLIYTLGRAFSYTALGVLLYFGASQLKISMIFQGWGEKLIGPLLILIGLFMLEVIKLKLPGFSKITDRVGERSRKSHWSTFLLGMVFAMAFCPYSGVLYFAMLIPITISSVSGLFLPVVFAIGTGLPVIIFAWLLAYAVGNVGSLYNKIRDFDKWFRRIMSVLFIIVGIYYIIKVYF
jgi:cytochrome c biogenesis protein CcdA